MLPPENPASFFPVMQTDFSEILEVQFQSITIVPETILGM